MTDILVLGAAGKEFVADGEHGGGDDGLRGHGSIRVSIWRYRSPGRRECKSCRPFFSAIRIRRCKRNIGHVH